MSLSGKQIGCNGTVGVIIATFMFGCLFSIFHHAIKNVSLIENTNQTSICDKAKRIHRNSSLFGNFRMFWPRFIDIQNFILLVRTVPFLRKIIFISSYTEKNNYFYCTN